MYKIMMITKFKCPECGNYNKSFLKRLYSGYFFPLTCRICNVRLVPHFAFSVIFTVVEQTFMILLAIFCLFTMDFFWLAMILITAFVLLEFLRLTIVPLVKKRNNVSG